MRINVLLTGVVCMLMYAVSWAAGPAAFKNFSADMETTSQGRTFSSKFYSKDGKKRMERSGMGREMITIVRPDKKVVWMIMPETKTYREMPFNDQKKDISSQLSDPNVKTEKQLVGNETVDGHSAKKYHVTVIMDGKKEASGFIWEAADLNNFPVKHQNEDKTMTTVWKNIKMGNVNDSLFELPSGYKKVDMPTPGKGGMQQKGKMK